MRSIPTEQSVPCRRKPTRIRVQATLGSVLSSVLIGTLLGVPELTVTTSAGALAAEAKTPAKTPAQVSPKAGLAPEDDRDTKAGDTKAGDTKAGDTKAGDTKAGDTKAGDTKAGDTKAGDTKAGDTSAPLLQDPLPAGVVAELLREVRDGGMSVDDPPVLALVNRLRNESPEPFLAAEADDSIRWEYLIRWSNSSRGRLFTLEGQLTSVQAHDLGPSGKVVEAVVREDTDRVFTVLLPSDPGDRNVRVRCRAYFVRVAEDTFRRPTPLLVARTWLRLGTQPTGMMGSMTDSPTVTTTPPGPTTKGEKLPVAPQYATSDGKPLNPDAGLLSRFVEELDLIDAAGLDQDESFDSGSATYTAMEMLATMSRDAFAIRPEERPIPWEAPIRSPKQFRSPKPVFVQGTVHKVELQPNIKDLGRPGPFWLAVMSSPESRRVHFVVLLKDPGRKPKFNARFKGFFVKLCRYSSAKNIDEVYQGGVFVAQELDVDDGAVATNEDSGGAADIIGMLIRGPLSWVFVPVVVLLITVRYIMGRRSKPDNTMLFRQHPQLAPADPLTSKAVIDTLTAMADGGPAPPDEQEAEPGFSREPTQATTGTNNGSSHGTGNTSNHVTGNIASSRSADDSRVSSLPPDLTKQSVSLSATERLGSDGGDSAGRPSDPSKSQN